MELLPEDPAKRKTTLALLAVVGLAALAALGYSFFGGTSVPNDPAAAAAATGEQSTEPPKSTGDIGGARRYTGD